MNQQRTGTQDGVSANNFFVNTGKHDWATLTATAVRMAQSCGNSVQTRATGK